MQSHNVTGGYFLLFRDGDFWIKLEDRTVGTIPVAKTACCAARLRLHGGHFSRAAIAPQSRALHLLTRLIGKQEMRMKALVLTAILASVAGAPTLALAQSDPATCAVKCHAANPNGCEGNSRATQVCYNKCVGYIQCPQPDKKPK